MSDSENDVNGTYGLFDEPADYFKPDAKAKFARHTLGSGDSLDLRLVGNNPLWVRHELSARSRVILAFLFCFHAFDLAQSSTDSARADNARVICYGMLVAR
jgi:hypothetical protein